MMQGVFHGISQGGRIRIIRRPPRHRFAEYLKDKEDLRRKEEDLRKEREALRKEREDLRKERGDLEKEIDRVSGM